VHRGEDGRHDHAVVEEAPARGHVTVFAELSRRGRATKRSPRRLPPLRRQRAPWTGMRTALHCAAGALLAIDLKMQTPQVSGASCQQRRSQSTCSVSWTAHVPAQANQQLADRTASAEPSIQVNTACEHPAHAPRQLSQVKATMKRAFGAGLSCIAPV